MNLTDPEKLILLMLSEIHEHLNIANGNGIDAKFIQNAVYSDNTWGLYWKFTGIFGGKGETPPQVREVLDIMEMCSMIEDGYRKLNAADRDYIEKDAGPFGRDPRFQGFDGNHEGEQMNIARFAIEELELYPEFRGRGLNAHMPSLQGYQRMLAVFSRLRASLIHRSLTAPQIAELLKERIHPENRARPATVSVAATCVGFPEFFFRNSNPLDLAERHRKQAPEDYGIVGFSFRWRYLSASFIIVASWVSRSIMTRVPQYRASTDRCTVFSIGTKFKVELGGFGESSSFSSRSSGYPLLPMPPFLPLIPSSCASGLRQNLYSSSAWTVDDAWGSASRSHG